MVKGWPYLQKCIAFSDIRRMVKSGLHFVRLLSPLRSRSSSSLRAGEVLKFRIVKEKDGKSSHKNWTCFKSKFFKGNRHLSCCFETWLCIVFCLVYVFCVIKGDTLRA